MPELPEVEAAARQLRALAVSKTIARLRVLHPAIERCLGPDGARRVHGRRVERVERRGKHQLVHLDDGAVLHVHFRMSGDWVPLDAAAAEPRHARAILDFADGSAVALVDPRALATLAVHPADDARLPALGPEPTDPGFDGESLAPAFARRRAPVKPVLLDQRVVAGVGNIYAAEALWWARISPRLPAASLGPRRRARLADALRHALQLGLDAPGRYAAGEEVARLRVYGRAGAPCDRCGGAIRRIVQAGRSTYFCPRCQRT